MANSLEFSKSRDVALNKIGSGLNMSHKFTDDIIYYYVCIVRRCDYNHRCRTFCDFVFYSPFGDFLCR